MLAVQQHTDLGTRIDRELKGLEHSISERGQDRKGGLRVHKELDTRLDAIASSIMQGGVLVVVAGIDVGPLRQQQLHAVILPIACRKMQCRPPLLILGVFILPGLKQLLQIVDLPCSHDRLMNAAKGFSEGLVAGLKESTISITALGA